MSSQPKRAARFLWLAALLIALAAPEAQAGHAGHRSRRNTVHSQRSKRHSRSAARGARTGAPLVESAANDSLKDGAK